MAKGEGKVRKFAPLEDIDTGILETFPHTLGDVEQVNLADRSCEIVEGDYKKNNLQPTITYVTKEFSAVCPFSGLPDIADVIIQYIPDRNVVELKSLKYYFMSFRDVGIYQEHVTQRIFNDLVKVLQPKWLSVYTKYNIRGGIDTTCKIEEWFNDSKSTSSVQEGRSK